ncbi:Pentatricopeptide repeat-containing protein, chloroplastic [Vitis vinifera]|uniref:Pentatricopeptide repeat-containing protein, chloroplastic n=1 Tax=Vitis vinifera TaxID=29760 RepID=A0A438IJ19_VITVI|nr:Pentatricopeptide repeat-containing protein, chloroplastic [Vitis vinifera]
MASTFPHTYFYNSKRPRNASREKRARTPQTNPDTDLILKPRIFKTARSKRNQSFLVERNSVSLTRALSSYVERGYMKNALDLFENMRQCDTFIWNVMIRGFVDNGLFWDAVDFYHRMEFGGVRGDNFTYPFVIKACGGLYDLAEGERVHGKVIKSGLDLDIYIGNSLIIMYAKIGCIESAEMVFREMPVRDLVSWNSMISGYVSVGDGWRSLSCFREMQASGIKLDRFSVIGILGACSPEGFLRNGKEIHCQMMRSRLELDVMVQTSLVDMYAKCGRMDYAERLFDQITDKSIVAWNAMIGGYSLNAQSFESFAYVRKMQEGGKLHPDWITMINLLPSCAQLEAILLGKSVHGFAIRNGFLPHLVLETALVDMYGECGKLKPAECLFGQMNERNLISWNAMIASYTKNGENRKAMTLFQDLCNKTLKPDATTIASILPAYAELASLREAEQIHGYVTKLKLDSNTFVSNSIVFMYGKCGNLLRAGEIFDRMTFKDVISWNTVIMAYAIHGFGRISIELFSEMREKGFEPNGSTFVSLLLSCSVAGLVNEGWEYFNSMKRDYNINPGIEHYGCILDLIGRTGNLDHAKNFIEEMPLAPTARIWGSLLTASRNKGDVELAEIAAEHILSLEHDNTGCYVLLSNMYAEAGRWEDVERIKFHMKKEGLEKSVGCSVVDLSSKTFRFVNQDRSDNEINMVYDVLDIISKKIGEDVYVHSLTKFRPSDLEKKRANSAKSHSLRLAICFGLISTTIGNPVLVRKNIRICEACHRFAKRISETTKREIIVRDSKIFHHFNGGHCSCGDYW